MNDPSPSSGYRQFMPPVVSTAALILLLFWLEGGFADKVGPGSAQADDAPRDIGPTIRVVAEDSRVVMAWPGTVSSRTEAQISPKIASRIEDILVRAGDRVQRGQILVRLDERSVKARLAQARAGLTAVQAEAARSRTDAQRIENLYRREAATQQTLDHAVAAARAAEARVHEAQSAIQEVEALFSETALRAPFDGVVLQRQREPGDTAMPGTPILTILEPGWLRVEAAIPLSCAGSIREGQALTVLDASHRQSATVEEIAPSADPKTHTLLIKARLPRDTSLLPGAFVHVEQTCGLQRSLMIPDSAVSRSGQIESVRLVRDGHVQLRHVRTGKRFEDRVEVLSGLQEGDTILMGAR